TPTSQKALDIIPLEIRNNYISSPTPGSIFGGTLINFVGTISSQDVSSYEMRYKKPDGQYSNVGLILAAPGPKNEETIATLDSNVLEQNGQYDFELKLNHADSTTTIWTTSIIIDLD